MKIGIDIGGSHIGMAFVKDNQIEHYYEQKMTKQDKEQINIRLPQMIAEGINTMLEKAKKSISAIDEIAIACAGVIQEGVVFDSVNLNIERLNLKQILEEQFHKKVEIRNDVTCFAMAEKEYGNMKGYDNALIMCIGTGLGGAMYEQGKLLPRFSHLGHMMIEANGIPCGCGKTGCFERYVSMRRLKDKIKQELGLNPDTSGKEVLDLLRTEDEKMKKILQEYIYYLAVGTANILNLMKPEVLCFGGSFAYYADVFIPLLQKELEERNWLDDRIKGVKIVEAKYKNYAGIIGAANL